MMASARALVYCGQSPLSLRNRTTTVKVRIAPNVYDYVVLNSTLPKSVQYVQLMPYVKNYDVIITTIIILIQIYMTIYNAATFLCNSGCFYSMKMSLWWV